jgi:hypothetical protein
MVLWVDGRSTSPTSTVVDSNGGAAFSQKQHRRSSRQDHGIRADDLGVLPKVVHDFSEKGNRTTSADDIRIQRTGQQGTVEYLCR